MAFKNEWDSTQQQEEEEKFNLLGLGDDNEVGWLWWWCKFGPVIGSDNTLLLIRSLDARLYRMSLDRRITTTLMMGMSWFILFPFDMDR